MSQPLPLGPLMSRISSARSLSKALAMVLALGAPAAYAQSFPQTPDTGTAALASQPALTADTQAPQLPALGEGIIVSVNNDMITSYDLKQRMLLLIVTSGVQVTQENYAAFQQQALNSLIDERLQQQEMDHWKVKVSDSDIDDEVARMAAQSNLKPDQLLSELKRVGVEPATLRAQIGAESGWSQLVGGRYHANANVGSAQVDSLMDKVIADGQKPQYLVAEIYIDNAAAGSPANALQGAKQLREQIANKVAPFQAVARQFSNAPSAANGGDAGWLVSGNIEPSVESVLTSLKTGEMSEPIPTKDGVYIYLLRQKTDGNADMVFRLKQAAVSLPANATPEEIAGANAALASFRSKVNTCQAFDDQNGKAQANVQLTDLGDAQLSTLLTNYSDALRPLKTNEATAPLRNAQNMNVLYVCDRALAGDNALTRDQVENNLVNQRLSMLGKRYLRELRSAATIENH